MPHSSYEALDFWRPTLSTAGLTTILVARSYRSTPIVSERKTLRMGELDPPKEKGLRNSYPL